MLKPEPGLRIERRPSQLQFQGRVLYLTEDPELIRRQLAGEDLDVGPIRSRCATTSRPTRSRPAGSATTTTRSSASTASSGLRGGPVKDGEVKRGGFVAVVSRPFEGLRLLARDRALRRVLGRHPHRDRADRSRRSTARTARTSACSRRPTSTLVERIRRGRGDPARRVHAAASTRSPRTSSSTAALFAYNVARAAQPGDRAARSTTPPRPMNLVEKIIARAVVTDAATGKTGVPAVKPGDALVRAHRPCASATST